MTSKQRAVHAYRQMTGFKSPETFGGQPRDYIIRCIQHAIDSHVADRQVNASTYIHPSTGRPA
ncbi:hypothetical protein [Spirosoma sordidisoli]|uniref:Uncharacterized protein n=1 Tax=Spirosoma sordidisoli TaxID=2502893 RepID=A0A4V1RWB1_9BACT|nr:hypothetical protein [Spirosoma sordidisoli]RYC69648.1 hypothetical protein EQG79_13690 [Spirosoma sordidisoli]